MLLKMGHKKWTRRTTYAYDKSPMLEFLLGLPLGVAVPVSSVMVKVPAATLAVFLQVKLKIEAVLERAR
jgi:hypothetical protein